MVTEHKRMRQLQVTEAEWSSIDPTLLDGELAMSSDVKRFKVGPGQWSSLAYWDSDNVPVPPTDAFNYGVKQGLWKKTVEYDHDYVGDLNLIPDATSFNRVTSPINGWQDIVDGDFVLMLASPTGGNAVQMGFHYSTEAAASGMIYTRVRRGSWSAWVTQSAFDTEPYSGDLTQLAVSTQSFDLTVFVSGSATGGWDTMGVNDIVRVTNIDANTAMMVGYEGLGSRVRLRQKVGGVWSGWTAPQVVEADISNLDRIRWKNAWINGLTYEDNDMAWEGVYTGVANKTTMDHVAPQIGVPPQYIYAGTLGAVQAPAKQLITGIRVENQTGGAQVIGYRIDVVAGNVYSTVLVEDPLGAAPIITQLLDDFNPNTTGYVELNVDGSILPAGVTFDLLLTVKEPDPAVTPTTHSYNYQTPNNPATPAAGVISHANQAQDSLRINKTAQGGVDATATLAALAVGDTIEGNGMLWAIQLITDNGTWYDFTVAPADQGDTDGIQDFIFNIVAAVPITFGRDPDLAYWDTVGLPNVAGLFFQDNPYDPAITDRSAYGVDLLFQLWDFSPDWDLLPQSGGGGSTGDAPPAGVTSFVELTDTPADYGTAGYGLFTDGVGSVYYGVAGTGPQGPQGEKGDKGDKGDTGDQGIQGPTGPEGPEGPQGPQGIQGIQGPQGEQGIQGPQGNDGADSTVPGPQGEKGDKGDTGDQGIQGPTGPEGPEGPQGEQGVPGENAVGSIIQNPLDSTTNVIAPVGNFLPLKVDGANYSGSAAVEISGGTGFSAASLLVNQAPGTFGRAIQTEGNSRFVNSTGIALEITGPTADGSQGTLYIVTNSSSPCVTIEQDIGSLAPAIICTSTSGYEIPRGTTAEEPTTPSTGLMAGTIRWNTDIEDFTVYDGASYKAPGVRNHSATATYAFDELVSFEGTIYHCIIPHSAQAFNLTNFAPISIATGSGTTFNYEWSTVVAGDPGSGRFGITDPMANVTNTIRVSSSTSGGIDVTSFWESINDGDFLLFVEDTGGAESGVWQATGAGVDQTGYFEIPVNWVANTGEPENGRKGFVSIVQNPMRQLPPGGTTGQALKKNSDTNYDVIWGDSPSEAPEDGVTYGRKDLSWEAVLPLTGGTVTGNILFQSTDGFDGRAILTRTIAPVGFKTWGMWTGPSGEWTFSRLSDDGVTPSGTVFTINADETITFRNSVFMQSTLDLGGTSIHNLNEIHGDSGSQADPTYAFSEFTTTGMYSFSGDAGEIIKFSMNGVLGALMDPVGIAVSDPTSVITREKGDARYVQSGTDNTGTIYSNTNPGFRNIQSNATADTQYQFTKFGTTSTILGRIIYDYSSANVRIYSEDVDSANQRTFVLNNNAQTLGTASLLRKTDGDALYAPAASSLRFKEQVSEPITYATQTSILDQVDVHRWTWGGELTADIRIGSQGYGFIAEEFVEPFPEAVLYSQDYDEDDNPIGEKTIAGLDPLALIAMLAGEIKTLKQRITALEEANGSSSTTH